MRIKTSKIRVDRDTFVQNLVQQKQNRQIGAGKFGSVFAHPKDNFVTKVCRDNAYRHFLIQALKCQTNPWFPKIQSAIEYHPGDEAPYLVIVMERLRKGTTAEIDGALCLFDNERFKDTIAMLRILGIKDDVQEQHLTEVFKVLHKLFRTFGPDFHKGNIMFRGTQAVLTDPIVEGAITEVPPIPTEPILRIAA